jgi:hypothetical protein
MPRPGCARQDLEAVWREKVSVASLAYNSARLDAAAVLAQCVAVDVTPDEEVDALKEAQRRESAALTDYMNALKVFHELVVEAKRPS